MPFLALFLIFVSSTLAMDAAKNTPALPGSAWTATTLAGQPVLADREVTFEFDTEGNINGNTSCNSFGGTCTITDGTIEIGRLRSTRRACAQDVMQQERSFLSLLASATSWAITGDELVLTSPEGEIKAVRRTAD